MSDGFRWQVAVKGYEWRHHQEPIGDIAMLVDEWRLEPVGKRYRFYQPMERYSGLFRTFAATPVIEDDIRNFANSFGSIGMTAVTKVPKREADEGQTRRQKFFEIAVNTIGYAVSFEGWKAAILEMRNAVTAWERIEQGERDQRILRELRELVDRQLASMRVQLRFRLAPGLDVSVLNPVLDVVPVTLLGAMWIQLAQAIVAKKIFRACATCKRWFELDPRLNRTSRHFCSDGCRHRAYRERKERARQLSSEGKSIRQIAKHLGVGEPRVAGWLQPRTV
jgi:hypothetical protein